MDDSTQGETMMPNISLNDATAGKPTKPMFRDDGSSFACVTLTDDFGSMSVVDTPERIAAIAAAFNGGTVIDMANPETAITQLRAAADKFNWIMIVDRPVGVPGGGGGAGRSGQGGGGADGPQGLHEPAASAKGFGADFKRGAVATAAVGGAGAGGLDCHDVASLCLSF